MIERVKAAVERQLSWTTNQIEFAKEHNLEKALIKLTGEKEAYEFVLRIIDIWSE